METDLKTGSKVSLGTGSRVHLLVEVGFGELQGVEQGVGGGQFDVVTGLLLPHALNDGCQDLVGVFLQLLGVLKEPQPG